MNNLSFLDFKKRRSLAGGSTTRLCFMKKIILLALVFVAMIIV